MPGDSNDFYIIKAKKKYPDIKQCDEKWKNQQMINMSKVPPEL